MAERKTRFAWYENPVGTAPRRSVKWQSPGLRSLRDSLGVRYQALAPQPRLRRLLSLFKPRERA